MPAEPTTAYRVVLSLLGLVALLGAFVLCMVAVLVLSRQGGRWPHPLAPKAIVVGVSASAAVGLYGSVQGMDTAELGLGIYFGTAVMALTLLTTAVVRQRRRTLVR